MKVTGYVVVTLKFRKEGRRWTAFCEELGTATFGRSIHEATKRIKEAVLFHLNTLEDVGERDRFFKENKITFFPYKPKEGEIKICPSYDPKAFFQPYVHPLHKALTS
jgi:predicted RNase H-like HicB family nuclease